jgi:hypothetical protein
VLWRERRFLQASRARGETVWYINAPVAWETTSLYAASKQYLTNRLQLNRLDLSFYHSV